MPAEDWIKKTLDSLDEGDNERAEKALLEAIAVDSLKRQTYYNLSIPLIKQEKYVNGGNAARAIELDPRSFQAWDSYRWALSCFQLVYILQRGSTIFRHEVDTWNCVQVCQYI